MLGMANSADDKVMERYLADEKISPEEIARCFTKGIINGSVVRWGERSGIATPINKTLVACVKGVESWLTHFGKR